MAKKAKARLAPHIDLPSLTNDFADQIEGGVVCEVLVEGIVLPPFGNLRGQPLRIDESLFRSVSLSDTDARRLYFGDVRVERSDLSNINMADGRLERVEWVETRLTGANLQDARLRNVLFQNCKLDLAMLRMARFEQCVFEQCTLIEADFYQSDLSGTVFRGCDLRGADVSQAKLKGADLQNCNLDGLKGTPSDMTGLVIDADVAPLLISLFGVRVR